MKSFRIHPATYVFIIILLLTGFSSVVLPYLIAITLHELAHAYVAKKLGYGLDKIWILPYGASIKFKQFSFNPTDEIKIAIAGPLMNIILIIITVMLWWIFPSIYASTYLFVITNFSIVIFNMLPAFPLDGGRSLNCLLKLKLKTKTVYKISNYINLFLSLSFLALFIISCFYKINFSFGLISIFLFLGIIDGKFQGTYSPILDTIQPKNKQIMPVKTFMVMSNTPLYKILCQINKFKFNVIYVKFKNDQIKILTEIKLKQLLETYPANQTLEEILK